MSIRLQQYWIIIFINYDVSEHRLRIEVYYFLYLWPISAILSNLASLVLFVHDQTITEKGLLTFVCIRSQ